MTSSTPTGQAIRAEWVKLILQAAVLGAIAFAVFGLWFKPWAERRQVAVEAAADKALQEVTRISAETTTKLNAQLAQLGTVESEIAKLQDRAKILVQVNLTLQKSNEAMLRLTQSEEQIRAVNELVASLDSPAEGPLLAILGKLPAIARRLEATSGLLEFLIEHRDSMLTATPGIVPGRVLVIWSRPPKDADPDPFEPSDDRFRVYRKKPGETGRGELIAPDGAAGSGLEATACWDTTAEPGVKYAYSVLWSRGGEWSWLTGEGVEAIGWAGPVATDLDRLPSGIDDGDALLWKAIRDGLAPTPGIDNGTGSIAPRAPSRLSFPPHVREPWPAEPRKGE